MTGGELSAEGTGLPWAVPASYAQERVWFGSQLARDTPVYHIVDEFPLPHPLSRDGVLAALAEVCVRHEPLRTSFRLGDGGLLQVVHPEITLPVDHLDLAGVPEDEARRRTAEVLDRLGHDPIPLDRPPLWRATLVRRGDGDWLLFLAVHHAVVDGASVLLLRAELDELCAATAAGRAARLPELEIAYADHAVWQRDRLARGELDRLLGFWREALADLPAVHGVPTDRPHPPERSFAGRDLVFDLPDGVQAELPGLARRLSVTPFVLVFAAYVALLHRLSGRPDIVVGLPVAGRDRSELQPLVGMFVNMVVVRVRVPGDPCFAELVGLVRETLLEVWEHQEMPYQKLVENLATARQPGVPPLYQLAFNFLDADLSRRTTSTEDDLMLEITGGQGRLEYNTALFEPPTAARIADGYLRVLAAGVADPQVRMSALPVTPPDRPAATPAEPPLRVSPPSQWVAPRTTAEELVAEVWSEVLGRSRTAALDDFFDLGGHSLLALRVIARLSAAAEVDLSLQAFFADPTVAGVAAELERLLTAELDKLPEDEARRLAAGTSG